MKAFGLVLVLALAAFGCDDGGGGTGGSGGSGPTGACLGTSDQDFACSEDNDIKDALTQCGVCQSLGFGCPEDCEGNPVPVNTPQGDCADLVMGPSCDPGLTEDCMGCYKAASECGLLQCAGSCSNIVDPTAPDSPGGCACLDCVDTECDGAFEACAGYSQGVADSGTAEDPAGDGEAGGPPTCPESTYCVGGREGAGGVCGNSVVEPPEECDPPGSPNASNEFCDEECELFDPCAAPLEPPASCTAPSNPQCESVTCSEDSGVITCGIANESAGTACDFAGTNDGTCDGSGACTVCTTNEDCPDTDCTTGTCSMTLGCQYANQATGTACGADDQGQCSSDAISVCQLGDCTDQGTGSNSEFICGPDGGLIKSILTQCGVCEALHFGCPTDCSEDTQPAWRCGTSPGVGAGAACTVPGFPGSPVLDSPDCTTDPAGPDCLAASSAVCAANILLRGGDGGACTTGMDVPCLDCYTDASLCGTTECTDDCSNLAAGAIDGPNGCQCIDCVSLNCDAAFFGCAGFAQGVPDGTPNPHPGIIGGPPICEDIPTPDCDN